MWLLGNSSFSVLPSIRSLTLIYGSCDKQTQDTIASLTYSDLITTGKGRDAARALLNTVINQQISYQISVDAISEILQQRCGSFCSADDVMQYKVSFQFIREENF
jgi:nuclear pore complex protein Nup155